MRMTLNGKTSDLDLTNMYVATEFERRFNQSFQVMSIPGERRIEWVAFIAYKAAEVQGVDVPATFDEFLKANPKLEEIEDESGEGSNPTDGAQ